MTDRRRLLVAVVLDGRDAAEVDGLRRAFGSTERERIPPHITLVPPVNVAGRDLSSAIKTCRDVAGSAEPIPLTIGPARTFPPGHHVVYLEVGGADTALAQLRSRLRVEPLVAAGGREPRRFVPHVTVTNRADDRLATAALVACERFVVAFTARAITVLERDVASPGSRWTTIAEIALGATVVVGRGGRELVLSAAGVVDAECEAVLDAAEATTDASPSRGSAVTRLGGTPFAISARHDGRVVAAAAGGWCGRICVVDRFAVAADRRREGIGGQLLGYLERFATDRGGCELVVTGAEGAYASWLAGRGFTEAPRPGDAALGAARFRALVAPD